jgi:lysozyme
MTVLGIDVSKWQAGLSLASVKAQGYRYVIAKCTEGQGYVDPEYDAFRAQAVGAQTLFAAYHWLWSDSTASAQAHNLASHIGDKRIPVMIDCEPVEDPPGSGHYISTPDLPKCAAFRDECHARGMRVTLLYLPHWYWQWIRSPSLATWTVVASIYGPNNVGTGTDLYPGDGSTRWDAYGGRTPALLQFGSRGRINGYPDDVDLDAWRGTFADLKTARLFYDYGPPEVDDMGVPHDVWDSAEVDLIDVPGTDEVNPTVTPKTMLQRSWRLQEDLRRKQDQMIGLLTDIKALLSK